MKRILCTALLAISVIAHAAEEAPPFSPGGAGRQAAFSETDGKVIYARICQGCHMDDGRGAKDGPSGYPALAANPRFAARAYPAAVVVNGLAAMPAFGTMLDDEQVSALVNYLRGSFANSFSDRLTAAEVSMLRPTAQARPTELRGR